MKYDRFFHSSDSKHTSPQSYWSEFTSFSLVLLHFYDLVTALDMLSGSDIHYTGEGGFMTVLVVVFDPD